MSNLIIDGNAVISNLYALQANLDNLTITKNTFIAPVADLIKGVSGSPNQKLYVYIEDKGTDFVRFSSGLQICFSRYSKNGYGPFTVNLSKPFLNTNYQIFTQQSRTTGQGNYTNTQNVVSTTMTTSSFQFGTDYSEQANVIWFAIGAWK